MAEIRNLVKFAALTAVLFLAAFLSAARADDDVKIAGVDGSALLREAGEYFWKGPQAGAVLWPGDRVRVRTGELSVAFPQGSLQVVQTGEFELPMVLVDGLAKPWANDLRLFIGEYAYLGSPNAQGPGLEIRTHYANIAFSPDADVRFSITGEGSLLTVNAGQITITHDAQPAPVGVPAGNRVRITGSGIRLMKVPSRSLAMSR